MKGKELLDYLEYRMNRMMRSARAYIDKQGDAYDETHDWLQQYAKGYGLDIASGNFPTMLEDGSSHVISVDGAILLGNVFDGFRSDATRLTNIASDSCDFVLCNYLDGMPSALQALNEWYRVLKPGGVMAVIVSDAEADRYKHHSGPLSNPRRLSLFTSTTLRYYMERSGLKTITIDTYLHQLRARGLK